MKICRQLTRIVTLTQRQKLLFVEYSENSFGSIRELVVQLRYLSKPNSLEYDFLKRH